MTEQPYEALVTRLDDTHGGYMTTYGGVRFYPLKPSPAAVNIYDIAHALSNMCRWGGHIAQLYTVAQHSCKVAKLVPKSQKLQALLHDASEAYLGDMIRPLKYLPEMGAYKVIERGVTAAIAQAFGLDSLEKTPEIDRADQLVLAHEALTLRRPRPKWALDTLNALGEPTDFVFGPIWEPEEAKGQFLEAFVKYATT